MADPTAKSTQRLVSERWTPALVKDGWTPISDFFIESYRKLNPPLNAQEVLLVIHLLRHKWDRNAPYPGFKTLARRMGITDTAARGHARSLEKKGYLRREKRVGTTNKFDLTPLFGALERLQAYQAGVRREATPLTPTIAAAPALASTPF